MAKLKHKSHSKTGGLLLFYIHT